MTDTALQHAKHRRHPTPREYWVIAFILGIITAIEVALSYTDFLGIGGPIMLVVAAVLKFAIVALWFMHLRFDLKLYTRFLVIGILGALFMFTVVLATFHAL